jgi:ERCC4-type nuclease
MERKRADDFAASIVDGRWREQTSRLFSTGYRVFFVIEGDLRWLDGMYEPMIGAIVNASLRSSCCFRSMDVAETACLVLHLEKKLQKCPPPVVSVTGLRPPQSKRQRASEADNVFARQLMCVPSVSERIAVALVAQFGDLETLQDALRDDTRNFPRVQIGEKTFLGRARIAKLAKHFLRSGAV